MTYQTIDSNARQPERPVAGRPGSKASFDEIYDAPNPGPYFSVLRPLDYRIPHFAQPLIRRLVSERRQLFGRERITVLDLCTGYGVNGALLKHDLSLDDLYRHYTTGMARTPDTDRATFASRRRSEAGLRMIGQDVAGRALAYARAAGFLDATLHANLERDDLTAAQADLIADTDLVTITGGLSYIGEATLSRVVGALRRPPWVLYFPLRGTDTDRVNTALHKAGLRSERWHQPLPQRRFSTEQERRGVLETVGRSKDGLGAASSTHQEAVLHLARPDDESRAMPMSALAAGLRAPLSRPVDVGTDRTQKPEICVGGAMT